MYSRNKEKTAGCQPCCFILPYIHIPILKQNRPVLFLRSTIHTFFKLVHACSIFQKNHTYLFLIRTRLFYFSEALYIPFFNQNTPVLFLRSTIHTFLKLEHACSVSQEHHTCLFLNSTCLFYFSEAPYIHFLNQYTPVLFLKSTIHTFF